MEGGSAIEAAGAATGKWGLADLLSALDANQLVQLSIQGPWHLPAAALRVLGRLTRLSWLELDSAQLPGEELQVALSQLVALQTLEMSTDELPLGLPATLARLGGLQALHLDVGLASDVGELLSGQLSSLQSITLRLGDRGITPLPSPGVSPGLREYDLIVGGYFLVRCRWAGCAGNHRYRAHPPAVQPAN